MVYGYIRVSTEKQTVENQRYEIENFCKFKGIAVDKWIEETISGTKAPDKRRLGKLLRTVTDGDILVATEISRLGRSLFMVMEILNLCLEKGCRVWTIRDGYRLGDDIQSKVLAFAFGLSAEIERNFISQRTKEALARKRANGMKLGRPVGCVCKKKLDGVEDQIVSMMRRGKSYNAIAAHFGVHRHTVEAFVKQKELNKIVPLRGVRATVYLAEQEDKARRAAMREAWLKKKAEEKEQAQKDLAEQETETLEGAPQKSDEPNHTEENDAEFVAEHGIDLNNGAKTNGGETELSDSGKDGNRAE